MCPRSHSPVAEPRLALNPSLQLVRGITLRISRAGLTPGKSPRGSPDLSQGPAGLGNRRHSSMPREASLTLQAPPCRSSGTSQPVGGRPASEPSFVQLQSWVLSPLSSISPAAVICVSLSSFSLYFLSPLLTFTKSCFHLNQLTLPLTHLEGNP